MFILTLSSIIFLWVFGMCVLFIYTISISIICVSQEEPSLKAYNQHIFDFYMWIVCEIKNIAKSIFS